MCSTSFVMGLSRMVVNLGSCGHLSGHEGNSTGREVFSHQRPRSAWSRPWCLKMTPSLHKKQWFLCIYGYLNINRAHDLVYVKQASYGLILFDFYFILFYFFAIGRAEWLPLSCGTGRNQADSFSSVIKSHTFMPLAAPSNLPPGTICPSV